MDPHSHYLATNGNANRSLCCGRFKFIKLKGLISIFLCISFIYKCRALWRPCYFPPLLQAQQICSLIWKWRINRFSGNRGLFPSAVCNLLWLVISTNKFECIRTPHIKLYIPTYLYTASIYIPRQHIHIKMICFYIVFHCYDRPNIARMAPDVAALITHNIKSCLSNLSEP